MAGRQTETAYTHAHRVQVSASLAAGQRRERGEVLGEGKLDGWKTSVGGEAPKGQGVEKRRAVTPRAF
eukprot:360825-Chlamydomonas_euryale.AAC.1